MASFRFLLPIFCIIALLCAITLAEFSSIDVISIHLTTGDQESPKTYFRGRLFCETGCSSDDKFSFAGGITTASTLYEISSVDIDFFNEKTGVSLVTLPPDQQYLVFNTNANIFLDQSIPFQAAIDAGVTIGFRGHIRYNWISKDQPKYLDTARFTYLPADPFTIPQNIVFETRFSSRGAEFSYIDGLWATENAPEGKFLVVLDNIATTILGIQIKLLGITWTGNEGLTCDINGLPAYSRVYDAARNTFTFMTPQKNIPAGVDVVVSCTEGMFRPLYTDLSILSPFHKTFAEIRLIDDKTNRNDPNFFHNFIYVRPVFNVIEPMAPKLSGKSIVYGNALVCTFEYEFSAPVVFDTPNETIQLQVSGLQQQVKDAYLRITPTDHPAVVLQSLDKWKPTTKSVFQKQPLSYSLPSDPDFPKDKIKSITITAFIPLQSATFDTKPFCRLDFQHPNPLDKAFIYPFVVQSTAQELAMKELTFPTSKNPATSTSLNFELEIKETYHPFNTFWISTTTFDFHFTGDLQGCGVTELSTVSNDGVQGPISNRFIPLVNAEFTENDDNQLGEGEIFMVKISQNEIIPSGSSFKLVCPKLFFSTKEENAKNHAIMGSYNTIIVQAFEYADIDKIILYSNTVILDPISVEKPKKHTGLIIFIVLSVVFVCVVIGFFIFRHLQKKRRRDHEQFQQLLVDEQHALTIQ